MNKQVSQNVNAKSAVRPRSFKLKSFLPLIAVFALAMTVLIALSFAATGVTATTVKSGAWSDATTWSGGKIPSTGDKVVIAAGHDILLDTSAEVNGLNLAGTLSFDPDKSVTLASDKNVLVTGQLVMIPKTSAIVHNLKFINVDETKFVGGGMDVIESDVGLWVMENGQLYTKGDQKRAWTNAVGTIEKGASQIQLVDASGWKVGDNVVVSPTHKPNFVDGTNGDNYNAFHEAKITAVSGNTITLDKPTTRQHPKVNGKWTAEVMNNSRNVIIGSQDYQHKAHIFIRSNKPQFIRYTEIAYMAPGEVFDEGYQARNQVLGRYALHFHHSGNGSRGSIVEGTSMHHAGFRGYVPHESHGITFRDTVAYDIGGGAYWWDNFEKAHDIMWDRTIAAKVTSEEGAYYMGGGDNVELKNSVAVGISASGATGGIEWENGQDGSWEFNNNIVHNVSGIGLRIWQNTSINHIVSNFAVYHANEHGIELGAYTNDYNFRNFEIYACGGAGIRLLAVSRGVSVIVENGVVDGGDVSKSPSISLGHSAVPGNPDYPILIRDVTLKGRAAQTSPSAVVFESGSNDKKVDLVDVKLEGAGPAELVSFAANVTANSVGDGITWARVQNATQSYRLRPSNQNLDTGAVSYNNGNAWKANIPRFRPDVWGEGTGILSEHYDDLALTQKIYTGIDPYVRYVKEDRPLYHLLDNKDTAVRYKTRVMAQATGRYEFQTEVSKERLWVNGQKLTDTWNAGGNEESRNAPVSAFIDLEAGKLYDLVFEAGFPHEIIPGRFNATFYASLFWKHPGAAKAIPITLSQVYLPEGVAHSPFTLNDVPTAAEPALPTYVGGTGGTTGGGTSTGTTGATGTTTGGSTATGGGTTGTTGGTTTTTGGVTTGGTTTAGADCSKYDLDGNNSINVLDALILLNNRNSTDLAKYDIDGNSSINILDALTILSNRNCQ